MYNFINHLCSVLEDTTTIFFLFFMSIMKLHKVFSLRKVTFFVNKEVFSGTLLEDRVG